jgi:fructose-bisphosphate aldolase class I
MEQPEMNTQLLLDTARAMVADDKGLLAMDESHPTCNKRFAKLGIPQTEAARRAYRELLITTPGLGESISGVILFDETIRQQQKDGTPFIQVITDAGIIPGIKPLQVALALGLVILVWPRPPATGFGNLAWPGGERKSGATSFASSRGAPW